MRINLNIGILAELPQQNNGKSGIERPYDRYDFELSENLFENRVRTSRQDDNHGKSGSWIDNCSTQRRENDFFDILGTITIKSDLKRQTQPILSGCDFTRFLRKPTPAAQTVSDFARIRSSASGTASWNTVIQSFRRPVAMAPRSSCGKLFVATPPITWHLPYSECTAANVRFHR